jgi:hypothetical protein
VYLGKSWRNLSHIWYYIHWKWKESIYVHSIYLPFFIRRLQLILWSTLRKISEKYSEEIYFHRELLSYSLEERSVELITISGHNGKLEDREDSIKGLFPDFD